MSYPRMHVSLYVHNIAETVNFYSLLFGKPADKIKDGYAKYILDKPSLIISFVENSERVSENFGHLGIQVETVEEMHERLDRVKNSGLKTKEEMGTNCCYAQQDKFWVEDPNGVQWEIYYFHQDVEFNDPRYTDGSEEVCCAPSHNTKKKVALADLATAESCDPESGCC